MRTDTREEFPHRPLRRSWPQEFITRRKFNRQAENQPYIEFLQTPFCDSDEDEDDGDDDVGDDDCSGEDEDEVGGHGDKSENINENVRRFMRGMTGDEDTLQYRDQVEQVASFCEQESLEVETRTTGRNRKVVALLDDRNDRGTIVMKQGDCRPYLGPLTSQELGKELSKPVAQILFSH